MKKIITLMLLATVVASCSSTTNMTKTDRKQQKEMKAQNIEALIKDSTFMIGITQGGESAHNMTLGLPRLTISSDYYLKVNKDKLEVYLPFSGRRTTATLSGGGIEVDTNDFVISSKGARNADGWDIDITTNDSNGDTPENFTFYIKVSKGGSVSMGARSDSREAVSYLGELQKLPK